MTETCLRQAAYDKIRADLAERRKADLAVLAKAAHDRGSPSLYWNGAMRLMQEDSNLLAREAERLWGPTIKEFG